MVVWQFLGVGHKRAWDGKHGGGGVGLDHAHMWCWTWSSGHLSVGCRDYRRLESGVKPQDGGKYRINREEG